MEHQLARRGRGVDGRAPQESNGTQLEERGPEAATGQGEFPF
jgi:hypothetical protein